MEVLPSAAPLASQEAMPASVASHGAACEAMSVEWRELRPGEEVRLGNEEIGVAVPFDGATCRALLGDATGHTREALVADPGVAILSPPGRHSLSAENEGALLLARLPAWRWTEKARSALGHVREIRESFVGSDDLVRGMAGFLSESLRAGSSPASDWLQAVADDLAVHLATRYGRPSESGSFPGLAPHRLQRVLALIEERLAEPIQVRDLASAVHMSPYHFARMFKQSTGQPPHLYITWQRMDRAKELLAQSSLPLAEIATRVGYQTQAHFTGVFHARVGVTPRAYRLRSRNAER